jgi:hypothetical protein
MPEAIETARAAIYQLLTEISQTTAEDIENEIGNLGSRAGIDLSSSAPVDNAH